MLRSDPNDAMRQLEDLWYCIYIISHFIVNSLQLFINIISATVAFFSRYASGLLKLRSLRDENYSYRHIFEKLRLTQFKILKCYKLF